MARPPTECIRRETAGMSSVIPVTLLAAEKHPRISGCLRDLAALAVRARCFISRRPEMGSLGISMSRTLDSRQTCAQLARARVSGPRWTHEEGSSCARTTTRGRRVDSKAVGAVNGGHRVCVGSGKVVSFQNGKRGLIAHSEHTCHRGDGGRASGANENACVERFISAAHRFNDGAGIRACAEEVSILSDGRSPDSRSAFIV